MILLQLTFFILPIPRLCLRLLVPQVSLAPLSLLSGPLGLPSLPFLLGQRRPCLLEMASQFQRLRRGPGTFEGIGDLQRDIFLHEAFLRISASYGQKQALQFGFHYLQFFSFWIHGWK